MTTKLFVVGIGSASSAEVRRLFAPYGPVSEVRIATDRETGRTRGFGFVTFSNREDAERAIVELRGYTFRGTKPLHVDYAVDKPEFASRSSLPPVRA